MSESVSSKVKSAVASSDARKSSALREDPEGANSEMASETSFCAEQPYMSALAPKAEALPA
eukprot:2294798-Rhodomonas_salina.2